MPMNGDLMGLEVLAAMDALSIGISEGDSQATIEAKAKDYREKLWKAICGAIVAHIQLNAVVSSNVAVVSVGGVTTGGGVSGPGTGTAVGTVA